MERRLQLSQSFTDRPTIKLIQRLHYIINGGLLKMQHLKMAFLHSEVTVVRLIPLWSWVSVEADLPSINCNLSSVWFNKKVLWGGESAQKKTKRRWLTHKLGCNWNNLAHYYLIVRLQQGVHGMVVDCYFLISSYANARWECDTKAGSLISHQATCSTYTHEQPPLCLTGTSWKTIPHAVPKKSHINNRYM